MPPVWPRRYGRITRGLIAPTRAHHHFGNNPPAELDTRHEEEGTKAHRVARKQEHAGQGQQGGGGLQQRGLTRAPVGLDRAGPCARHCISFSGSLACAVWLAQQAKRGAYGVATEDNTPTGYHKKCTSSPLGVWHGNGEPCNVCCLYRGYHTRNTIFNLLETTHLTPGVGRLFSLQRERTRGWPTPLETTKNIATAARATTVLP